jgi:hypothetical protein
MSPNINNPQWLFEQLGTPALWLRQGDLLRESADVLFVHGRKLWESERRHGKDGEMLPDLSVDQSIVMYLYALAIENVIKGIIVARNTAKLCTGEIPWSRYGHRLSKLFSEAGLKFKDTYEEQLIGEHFQHFLNWGGRYPIPRYKDEFKKSPLFHHEFLSTSDFCRIYEPLRKILLIEIGKVNRL